MKALITGASSGIGKEIAKKLLSLNYKVLAISRDFDKCDILDKNFITYTCDLSDTACVHTFLQDIKDKDISILVNSAGIGYFAPHEELSIDNIEKIIYLNLTLPLLLSKVFLKTLKKNRGYIFNICSISGIKQAPFGAVYGATKAGLRHFSSSLFAENRKSGLKVVSINPDITNTNFFHKLNFFPSDDPLSYIEPSCIAEVIEDILHKRDGTVISDITIEPQIFRLNKRKYKNTKKDLL